MLNHISFRQSGEPFVGNPTFAPVGAGKLPAHGAGGVGIIAEIHGLQDGFPEIRCTVEGVWSAIPGEAQTCIKPEEYSS